LPEKWAVGGFNHRWQVDLSGGGTPVIANGKLYALGYQGEGPDLQEVLVCLDADTLSADPEVRPLNVRRLMILLRKVTLRAGNRFTFEPNGERLRRALKRGFEAALEEMFARGAFAGARSRDAFRVSTDEPPNTRQDADAGRFLAEIRVAPSRPLSFLTVRLVQRGESTVAQEVR